MKYRAVCTLLSPALLLSPPSSGAPGEPVDGRQSSSLIRRTLSALPLADAGTDHETVPANDVRLSAKEHMDGISFRMQDNGLRELTSTGGCYALHTAEALSSRLWIARPDSRESSGAVPRAAFVRGEKLIEPPHEGPGPAPGTSLEVHHLWVDARTGGVQRIGQWSVALVPITVIGQSGLRMYAYRDDQTVHVLLTRDSRISNWDDGRPGAAPGDCAHIHLRLDARDINGPKSSFFGTGSIQPRAAEPVLWLALHASLSKSTLDPEPLLSVGVSLREERSIPQPRKRGIAR